MPSKVTRMWRPWTVPSRCWFRKRPDALDVQLEPIDGAVAVAGAIPIASADAPEAAYTAWNIMALLLVVLLLSVTGMLMADIVRNMWAWNGDVSATSGLANSIIDALGMK